MAVTQRTFPGTTGSQPRSGWRPPEGYPRPGSLAPWRACAIIQFLLALTITADDAGQRLDRFLRKALPDASLGQIFAALRRGQIRIGGARADGGHRLAVGQVVELTGALATLPVPAPRPHAARRAAPHDLAVVFHDADLLVVDKPAGLALHPGTGIVDHLVGRVHTWLGPQRGHSFKLAPAHRLDKDTSGLVVFGVSAAGLRGFAAALRAGTVHKIYLALVHGAPAAQGDIDLALMRDDAAAGPKVRVDASGVPAHTRYRLVARMGERSLLEIELGTGRTHQIRTHLAAIGHPLVGDRRYGGADGARRLGLHAWRLAFAHPVSGEPLRLQAEPPPELRA